MSFHDDLLAQQEEFASSQEKETVQDFEEAIKEISHIISQHSPLREGDTIPEIELPNANEEMVSVEELLREGPIVLQFYRGVWCPYCNLQLREYQTVLQKLTEQGAHLVAISPQTPDSSMATQDQWNLDFEVLSDLGNTVAKSFGIVFSLPARLRHHYEKMGIDLPEYNEDGSWELPVPATYIINENGKIVFAHIEPDYRKRVDPKEILDHLT